MFCRRETSKKDGWVGISFVLLCVEKQSERFAWHQIFSSHYVTKADTNSRTKAIASTKAVAATNVASTASGNAVDRT